MTHSAFKSVLLVLALVFGIATAQAGSAADGKVALFLTIKTQDGQRAALVDLWEQHLKARAEKNEDHVVYIFATDVNDANTVHISEVYATQAAFQTASQSPWFGAFMAEVGPLLAAEPQFAMAAPHWVK